MTHLKPTDSIGSSKSFTSLEIFGPMARDIIATHANTIGSTVTAFCRLAQNAYKYIIKSNKGKLMKPTKMWQHKSCNQSLYHTLFIIGQFTVKQWQKTAAFRGTCRINLRKWKYQFTLESLPKPDNSNSYRTPHCKHRSMVRISEQLRDCTTLFSFLDPRSSIIETQDSILASRNSKRSSLDTQGSSYEFQGSSVNLLLSGTVSIILYIPDWKNIVV